MSETELNRLLETVADIAYNRGWMRRSCGNSLADVLDIIHAARKFKAKHVNTLWGVDADYIIEVDRWAEMTE